MKWYYRTIEREGLEYMECSCASEAWAVLGLLNQTLTSIHRLRRHLLGKRSEMWDSGKKRQVALRCGRRQSLVCRDIAASAGTETREECLNCQRGHVEFTSVRRLLKFDQLSNSLKIWLVVVDLLITYFCTCNLPYFYCTTKNGIFSSSYKC